MSKTFMKELELEKLLLMKLIEKKDYYSGQTCEEKIVRSGAYTCKRNCRQYWPVPNLLFDQPHDTYEEQREKSIRHPEQDSLILFKHPWG